MAPTIPPGKTIIHATNDERDLNKNYRADHPILGDAKLVLRPVHRRGHATCSAGKRARRGVAGEIASERERVAHRSGCRS